MWTATRKAKIKVLLQLVVAQRKQCSQTSTIVSLSIALSSCGKLFLFPSQHTICLCVDFDVVWKLARKSIAQLICSLLQKCQPKRTNNKKKVEKGKVKEESREKKKNEKKNDRLAKGTELLITVNLCALAFYVCVCPVCLCMFNLIWANSFQFDQQRKRTYVHSDIKDNTI